MGILRKHQQEPECRLNLFASFVYAVLLASEMEAVSFRVCENDTFQIPDWSIDNKLKIYKCKMRPSKIQIYGELVIVNVCQDLFTVNFLCESTLTVFCKSYSFGPSDKLAVMHGDADVQYLTEYAKTLYYKIRNDIAIPGRANLSSSIGFSDSALESLPIEVLTRIFDELETVDLVRLSQTCTRLNSLCKVDVSFGFIPYNFPRS